MNTHHSENSLRIPTSAHPRIVIIGGGFAGVQLAQKLKGKPFQVVLLDRHNYHTFQPLLYQVATAGLEPDSIAGPLRKLIERSPNFYFRLAEVLAIRAEEHLVETKLGVLHYDYLVIANGSKTNYFGNEEAFGKAFPLKQIPQALDLRSYILQNFEKAVITENADDLQSLMNFIVVGGGPTGVEVSGALGELKKHVLPHDYPELDFRKMNIYLMEGAGRLLNGMSEKSGNKALEYLKRFDVNVKLNTLVKSFDGQQAVLNTGEKILARTVVWAAGVKGNIIQGLPKAAVERDRIVVDVYNKVIDTDNVFAIGDIAVMKSEDYPNGHPMLAPVAMQQGSLLAQNFLHLLRGKPLKAFRYLDKGSMATIGRNKAVVDLPKGLHFGGLFAWFVWMFVHLVSIIGFRSKLVVLSNWIWNYFTYDRGTRLIIRPYIPKGGEKVPTNEPEKVL
ncbi:NAD(P)/FAD-dependent oxidoreductase [Cytophagales bacterium LB-30]|uniref:NADH:ubiquinone reductase (non-electrogenic) n=1 Tax=Shiella aurantiaca TaxID=3058365 RepID=A0ABT8F6T4_9BACT|nr:NAD(P)/FAD-dependent oxidoreductase [Shiella aurantiaca]MDN4166165.1 NAD(P)/FAD-dependent oxidoreductase [Shiella aurantiaca]